MTREPAGLIVVGVDGSPQGDAALVFALTEAARAGDSVEVVTVWHVHVPALWQPVLPVGATRADRAALRRHAEEVQQHALQRVGVPKSVVVSSRLVEGAPGPALVDAARRARLLVVGSRSIGSLQAGLLGSVSRYCAHHATGPVVVVPASARRKSPRKEQTLAPARSSMPGGC
jgi:nucleotide-binding universal stress UspA family protein